MVDHIAKDVLDGDDLAAIEAADAVIVVTGLTAEDEGEGLIGAGDRLDLDLSPERETLIRDAAAANARTIVVLEGGGAITMGDWLPDIEALLMVWYPGQMGGYAIADLLVRRSRTHRASCRSPSRPASTNCRHSTTFRSK